MSASTRNTMQNPETALSIPRPPAKPTTVNEPPFSSSDSLVFFLTKHLDGESDRAIREQIQAHVEDFEKRVWYFPWCKEEDGTLEDVQRIAKECSVEGKPYKSSCIFFVDQQSAKDGKVLIVECTWSPEDENLEPGSIRTRGRMLAKQAPCAVVNSDLGNMELVSFLRSDNSEWKGELHYHHEAPDEVEVDTDDDSLKNVGDD